MINTKFLAYIYTKLNRLAEAESIVWKLIDKNCENHDYFEMLYNSRDVDSADTAEAENIRRNAIKDIIERYPQSRLAERKLLELLSGNNFINITLFQATSFAANWIPI